MVNIGSLTKPLEMHDRKYQNPFQPGDLVVWTPPIVGRGVPDGPVTATVLRASVGVDEDNPNLVRCVIEYRRERFNVHAGDLELFKRVRVAERVTR